MSVASRTLYDPIMMTSHFITHTIRTYSYSTVSFPTIIPNLLIEGCGALPYPER